MSAGDEAVRRQARLEADRARRQGERDAEALEAERARPVPRPDRVVACDRQDLVELFGDMHERGTWRGMNQHAYTAAERICAAAGIGFP